MPKEIDESKLNYNKYPGEHVIASGDVVQVGDKTFHVVSNYKEAFDAEKLEQRFSDVLDKYDYIVGDWGFEQLRLKGFFSASRKKMLAENKIDHLEDYINEYCNYGCAYFVLRRIRTRDMKREEAFVSEKLFTEKELKQKTAKPRRKRNRKPKSDVKAPVESGNEKSEERKNFKVREKNSDQKPKRDGRKPQANKAVSEQKFTMNSRPKRQEKSEKNNKSKSTQSFVIRTRSRED